MGNPEMMSKSGVICRHTLATRVLHWVNALCVFLVLMSGLQIFNAHPRLYWGKYGANTDRAVLDITQRDSSDRQALGPVRLGNHELPTTCFMRVPRTAAGEP